MMVAQAYSFFAEKEYGIMEKDVEVIETQAFRMGARSEVKELIESYAEAAEERDCFCF